MFCTSSYDTNEAGICDVAGINHCNGIIKRGDFIDAKFHTLTYTNYCATGCRVPVGNSCRSNIESLCLRRIETAISIRRVDHYELYCDGSPGSLCDGQ